MADPTVRQMTLAELFTKLHLAQERMGRKNPHRELLAWCEQVIVQLASRLEAAERPVTPETPAEPEPAGYGAGV